MGNVSSDQGETRLPKQKHSKTFNGTSIIVKIGFKHFSKIQKQCAYLIKKLYIHFSTLAVKGSSINDINL